MLVSTPPAAYFALCARTASYAFRSLRFTCALRTRLLRYSARSLQSSDAQDITGTIPHRTFRFLFDFFIDFDIVLAYTQSAHFPLVLRFGSDAHALR